MYVLSVKTTVRTLMKYVQHVLYSLIYRIVNNCIYLSIGFLSVHKINVICIESSCDGAGPSTGVQ